MDERSMNGDRDKDGGRDREREILRVLDEHGQLSVIELADVMGAHPVAVDRHCYRLHDAGDIRLFSGGLYTLTAHGEQSLADR